MGSYEADARVRVTEDELFAYLSDVANLPHYVSRISAATQDGEDVHFTFTLPSGDQIEREAWLKIDSERKTLSWGVKDRHGVQGHVTTIGYGENSALAVTVSTELTEGVKNVLDEAVLAVKKHLEEAEPRPHFDASWSGPMKEEY